MLPCVENLTVDQPRERDGKFAPVAVAGVDELARHRLADAPVDAAIDPYGSMQVLGATVVIDNGDDADPVICQFDVGDTYLTVDDARAAAAQFAAQSAGGAGVVLGPFDIIDL
jgi:hypothetical protein